MGMGGGLEISLVFRVALNLEYRLTSHDTDARARSC